MKIYLSLAFHNHQPVGNFGWVFQEAFEKSYLPMVECLERHPAIRVALHYTGPLRDWLVENQPSFLPRVRTLVERGQVEILSGAYYEPVLVSLRDVDKAGQIRKLTEAVRTDFGFDATGLWLAERIWEPHLPQSLADAGISYTIVDDTHFKAVGYNDEDLLGYFVTEEQGKSLKVFATSMELRYSIPWKPVEDVIAWLKVQHDFQSNSENDPERPMLALMGDDGEKFGMWPSTYDHVWKGGWMDQFFEAIEASSDWLEMIQPGEFATKYSSIGRVYLPTSSYDEMGEWALPPDQSYELHKVKHDLSIQNNVSALRFMRGGHWRSFMVKYAEVNQLHKKALSVSNKVHAMPASDLKTRAVDLLWAGQCNCGYWHGTFGGIYLYHIREADYRHLIRAENFADGLIGSEGSTAFGKVEEVDFDLDGDKEIVISTNEQTLMIAPNLGGAVTEWDFRAAEYNLLNVLTRRREGHHKTLEDAAKAGAVVTPDTPQVDDTSGPRNIHSVDVLAREANLEQKLIYDGYRRVSLIDHFFDETAELDPFYRSTIVELGDFVTSRYSVASRAYADNVEVELMRSGHIRAHDRQVPVSVAKKFTTAAGSRKLAVNYVISNLGQTGVSARFGTETNWGLAGGNDEHTTFKSDSGVGRLGEVVSAGASSEWEIDSRLWDIRITTSASRKFEIWRFPLETISLSEGGYERNYQGTTILMWWLIKIGPGEQWDVTIDFQLTRRG